MSFNPNAAARTSQRQPPSHDVDHCGHWFGHTWLLLESFKATNEMVARAVMVVAGASPVMVVLVAQILFVMSTPKSIAYCGTPLSSTGLGCQSVPRLSRMPPRCCQYHCHDAITRRDNCMRPCEFRLRRPYRLHTALVQSDYTLTLSRAANSSCKTS